MCVEESRVVLVPEPSDCLEGAETFDNGQSKFLQPTSRVIIKCDPSRDDVR